MYSNDDNEYDDLFQDLDEFLDENGGFENNKYDDYIVNIPEEKMFLFVLDESGNMYKDKNSVFISYLLKLVEYLEAIDGRYCKYGKVVKKSENSFCNIYTDSGGKSLRVYKSTLDFFNFLRDFEAKLPSDWITSQYKN